jgi:hypothetical protein
MAWVWRRSIQRSLQRLAAPAGQSPCPTGRHIVAHRHYLCQQGLVKLF